MSKKRIKFFVDSEGLFTHGAIIFMVLAAIFTLLGSLGQSADRFFMLTGLVLPLICEVLFTLCIALFGRKTMLLTALPTVLFAVFFIIRAFSFASAVFIVIFTVLYLAVAVLFTATVFGWIRNKWILAAFIFLTLAFNVAVRDYPALSAVTVTVTFPALMQEIAVLFILMGLLFSALALKSRRGIEDVKLPKMGSHKVVVKNENKTDAIPAQEELSAPETETVLLEEKKDCPADGKCENSEITAETEEK